jgi:hypothetical protein
MSMADTGSAGRPPPPQRISFGTEVHRPSAEAHHELTRNIGYVEYVCSCYLGLLLLTLILEMVCVQANIITVI